MTNAAALDLVERCEITSGDATRLPKRSAAPALDLIFIDPPYTEGWVIPALSGLSESGWLAPGALAVVEVGAMEATPKTTDYTLLDERIWGAAKVAFLKRG